MFSRWFDSQLCARGSPFLFQQQATTARQKMANSKEKIAEFVRNNLSYEPDPDAILRMSRMLNIDRSITDINIKDSTYSDYTALHFQAEYGTTGSVAWLLRQDPPPGINILDIYQSTPLMEAVLSGKDSEGKVRLLLDHGADRDMKDRDGDTALDIARSRSFNGNPAVIDMLKNYHPDVSR